MYIINVFNSLYLYFSDDTYIHFSFVKLLLDEVSNNNRPLTPVT